MVTKMTSTRSIFTVQAENADHHNVESGINRKNRTRNDLVQGYSVGFLAAKKLRRVHEVKQGADETRRIQVLASQSWRQRAPNLPPVTRNATASSCENHSIVHSTKPGSKSHPNNQSQQPSHQLSATDHLCTSSSSHLRPEIANSQSSVQFPTYKLLQPIPVIERAVLLPASPSSLSFNESSSRTSPRYTPSVLSQLTSKCGDYLQPARAEQSSASFQSVHSRSRQLVSPPMQTQTCQVQAINRRTPVSVNSHLPSQVTDILDCHSNRNSPIETPRTSRKANKDRHNSRMSPAHAHRFSTPTETNGAQYSQTFLRNKLLHPKYLDTIAYTSQHTKGSSKSTNWGPRCNHDVISNRHIFTRQHFEHPQHRSLPSLEPRLYEEKPNMRRKVKSTNLAGRESTPLLMKRVDKMLLFTKPESPERRREILISGHSDHISDAETPDWDGLKSEEVSLVSYSKFKSAVNMALTRHDLNSHFSELEWIVTGQVRVNRHSVNIKEKCSRWLDECVK